MQRWHLPLCALLLLSLASSCSQPSGLVLVVTVDPPTSGEALVELRATVQVDGKATTTPIDPIQVQPGAATRFSLKLDQGTRGKLALTVEGRPNYAYVTHKGTKTVQLDEDRRYDTNVELKIQTQCSDTGWCWEHARPRGNALRDVWGTGPNDIWVVGDGGTILHYDGWAFSSVPILDERPTDGQVINPHFTAVHGTSATDVWAISDVRGGQSQLFSLCKYDPAVGKFKIIYRVDSGGFPSFRSLWVSKDSIWIDGFRMMKQDPNKFIDMKPVTSTDLSPGRADIYRMFGNNPQDPDDLWAVGSVYDTNRTSHNTPAIWHWKSSAWVRESVDPTVENTNNPLYHIWVSESGDMWASSQDGNFNLFKSSTGQMWLKKANQDPAYKGIVYGANQDGTVLAVSGNANELQVATRSRSKKSLFSQLSLSVQTTLTDGLGILRAFTVPGQSPPVMYLVGEGGLILRYDTQKNEPTVLIPGTSPSPAYQPGTSASSAHLNDIYGFSDKDIWAVGNKGAILHYNGVSWTEETPKITQKDLRAVWGIAPDDVWVVGEDSTILHRTSLDGAFAAVSSPVSARPLNDVWGTSAQNVFIVGNNNTLLHWDGTTWTAASNVGFSGDYQGVWAADQNNVFVAGVVGTTGYVYHGDGLTWTNTSIQNVVGSINKIRGSSYDNVALAAGTGDKVWIYNGSMWSQKAAQARYGIAAFSLQQTYFVGDADAIILGSDPRKTSMGGSNVLKGLWGTAPTNMWAVGESGTILHYQGSMP